MDIDNMGIPAGLSMALSRNIYAMEYFSSLSESDRQEVIGRARNVRSQDEMRLLVDGLIPH